MNNAQRTVVLFFCLVLAPVLFYVGGATPAWRWLQGEAAAFIILRLIRVVLPVLCVGLGLYVWAGWDEGRKNSRVPQLDPMATLLLAIAGATVLGGLLFWVKGTG